MGEPPTGERFPPIACKSRKNRHSHFLTGWRRAVRWPIYLSRVTSNTPHDLEAALAERYTLRNVLGRGGMATVYLADDRKHQREVAVKVLRRDLAATLGAERFLKEIQIVARLTHPHILALHDSGEAAGFLYYVMPYIDGGSLRRQLEERRCLSRAEALEIATPVADALSYAHRMGIFHRDIKPENILFSQGHPIVADFGIAKALSTAGAANLTRTGFPLGTPGYMSPEQAAGMTDLDERSDVYSLAVVIYEMLTGEIPGRWPTEDAVRAGRFLEAPPSHRGHLDQAGVGTEGALVRGLSIRHDQRTPTPAALMAELRGGPQAVRRKYREDEVKEIVRRASELEASNPTQSGAMTIGGVESLAREVGIEPSAVRSAAKSMERRTLPAPTTPAFVRGLIGSPTSLMVERVVEGELPPDEFPTLVEEIRRELQHVGQVSQLGWSFSWTMTRSGNIRRDVEVAVTVRGGQTRIIVRESLGPLVGLVFGAIGGGLGGGMTGPILSIGIGALGLPPSMAGAIIPIWLMTAYGIARRVYRTQFTKREELFNGLADHLAQMTEQLIPRRPQLWNPGRMTGERG
jgi:serine/threonine protein kinase